MKINELKPVLIYLVKILSLANFVGRRKEK